MNIPTIHLVLLIASVWRLSNLIVHEAGPSYVFARLRKWASKSRAKWVRKFGLVDLLNCEYCVSVWFGVALSLAYGMTIPGSIIGVGWFVIPLALSTGAILIKHIVFLIKSVDTRFDQQNQEHLAKVKTPAVTNREDVSPTVWDAALFDQNSVERR